MATQSQTDRQEAAKKAAATRQRNQKREASSDAGRKAAATRHRNDALKAAKLARKDAGNALSDLGSAAKSVRDATVSAGKSVTSRVRIKSSD